jgi:hypothetical protein
MWEWIVIASLLVAGVVTWLVRNRATPDRDLDEFCESLTDEICRSGPEYGVRGFVPGTFTMVVSVKGQEVPVPLDNLFRHYLLYPEQIGTLARQLLSEIEEVGLEHPEDRLFSDSAMQILPQVCRRDWVFENAPAFGDGALVHRELGPDLLLCYVVDDPWSVVFICQAHLRCWGRSEDDLFHLASRNLRRITERDVQLPDAKDGPVRIHTGDGYDAARVLLLDPDDASDLLVAMPEQETLYLGREADLESLESMLRLTDNERIEHPVSTELFRFEDQHLVPVGGEDRE